VGGASVGCILSMALPTVTFSEEARTWRVAQTVAANKIIKVTVSFKAGFLMISLQLQTCGGVERYTLPEHNTACELGKKPRTLVDYILVCTGKYFR
jgi:hypothetical protein